MIARGFRSRPTIAAAAAWLAASVALCATAALLRPARAEIAPQAQPVVERYLEATGGRAAFESARSAYTHGIVKAFGMAGSADGWSMVPDRQATGVALGPFKLQTGFDGATGWRTDPNGKLVMLDGKDLDEAKASAWFGNERWLAPDQGGGRVAFAGEESDSAGRYAVLEITPPVGRERKFYFDQSTGLLVRQVAKSDAQIVVVTFSDYREYQGRRLPFTSVQSVVGMPLNTLTITTDSIAINVAIPDSRFAPPGEKTIAVKWLRAEGTASLPFQYQGRHVWMKASVNGGPPADFIYDTGASMTVIDSAYAAQIGLGTEGALQGQGAGASGQVSFSHLQSLRVAAESGDGVELSDVKVAVLAINSFLAPFFWRECAGVIGYNVIGLFVNRVDYDGGRLTLSDPKTFQYQGRGAAVPFKLAGTMPVVPMTIDGKYSGDFRLDVGSGSTVDLHTPFVEKHALLGLPGPGVDVMGGGFGGTFTSRARRMKEIRLGPYSWAKPLVTLGTSTTGMLASEDYAGNLGNSILDRFTLTLDYDRRLVYLEPGKNFKKPDRFSGLGAQLAKIEGKIVAAQVLQGSPAERAGMRKDDEVVAVNGKPALSYDPDALRGLFEESRPGTRVTLDLMRDGKPLKVAVKLKEML